MVRNYKLGFIDDDDIFNHVHQTVQLYRRKISLNEFNSNIVDPIKLTFDSKVYCKSISDIIETECIRQIDKTNTNHIGYFHQNLFRYASNRGWEVLPNGLTGFDVQNTEKHIFVELKNKHNTMNASSAQKTYMKMQSKILEDDQAQCMLVEVIAKASQNNKWTVTLDRKRYAHERIRRVSIDRFYEIVFEDKTAFFKLCTALPKILDDVLAEEDNQDTDTKNTVFQELNEISPNILKSLYLLAFKTYEGFEKF